MADYSREDPQSLSDGPCSTRGNFHTWPPAAHRDHGLKRSNIAHLKPTGLSTGLLNGVKSRRTLRV
jgi:hypothetical protein